MPLRGLRNALSFRRDDFNAQRSRAAAASAAMNKLSVHSSGSWNSTSADFACLRYFVWTGGDPGFTLTTSGEDEDDSVTPPWDENADMKVEHVTSVNVWDVGIRPGDVLETVGNKRVDTMDAEAAIVLVQMAKAPSVVRFRSSTSGKRVRFDVLLSQQNNLGVSFTGDGSHDVPVVTRVTSSFRSGSQCSSSGIRIGDVLVAVNGMDAIAAGLEATMKFVETCPRPLRLTFERAANEDSPFKRSQVASEHSGEQSGGSFALRNAIPNLAASGMKVRAAASLRCREFLRSITPAEVHYPPLQFQAESRSRANTPSEVFIEWESGPLGLTLQEDAISGAATVNRLTGKGSSVNMDQLQHGFQLYSINGKRTEGRRLKEVCQDLLSLPKPVQLIFRSPGSDSTSEEDKNSESGSKSSASSPLNDYPYASSTGLDVDTHRVLVAQSVASQHCGQVPLHEQHEYEVIWTTSRLELQLKVPGRNEVPTKTNANNTPAHDRYPVVHKILKECALDLPKDAVGDLFVSVNHWRTSGLSTIELRALLRAATKPAVLRFRRRESWPGFQLTVLSNSSRDSNQGLSSSSPAGATYSILWTEGKLGITFGCYEDADCRNALVVYVKRIEDGQARKSKMVSVGDILCSINGKVLPSKQKFSKTVHGLVTTNQPVTLGFRRLLVECSSN